MNEPNEHTDTLFRVRVTGTETTLGTILRPFEDEYEITAESAPSALLQLIHRDLWWDTLDIDRPFTIEIEEAASREGTPGGAPTIEELEMAHKRLQPYIDGYPEPMIDARRLRISNGTASEQDRREVAAEDQVIRELKGEPRS